MRTLFSLLVITAIVYLGVNESPQLKNWINNQRIGTSITAVEIPANEQVDKQFIAYAAKHDKALQEILTAIKALKVKQQLPSTAAYERAVNNVALVEPVAAEHAELNTIGSVGGEKNTHSMSAVERRKALALLSQHMAFQSLGMDASGTDK